MVAGEEDRCNVLLTAGGRRLTMRGEEIGAFFDTRPSTPRLCSMPEPSIDLEAVRRHFENDHFAISSGIRPVELRRGHATAVLPIEDRHLNSVGIVQGGAIFTLADLAFAMASNSHGRVAVAINTNLSFLKATQSGTLYAEASEVSRTRRISTCSVRVTDDAGALVALFHGTAYIKDQAFPPP